MAAIDRLATHPGLLIIATFVAAACVYLFTLPCPDLAWLSWSINEHLQHGGAYYRDIIEPNPPLIFWMYTPPVMLANTLGLHPVLVIRLFSLVVAGVSIVLASRILETSRAWSWKEKGSLALAMAAFFVLGAESFIIAGQREHLFVLLVWPYLCLNVPSVVRRDLPFWIRVTAGVLAAIGFCIKPYFLLVWVVAMMMRCLRERVWGVTVPDIIIAAAVGSYTLALAFLFPDYLELAGVMTQTYASYGGVGESVWEKVNWFLLIAVLALILGKLAGVFERRATPAYQDIHFFVMITVAAFIQAFVQFKTWGYIFYPMLGFGGMALAAAIIHRRIENMAAVAAILVLCFPISPWSLDAQKDYRRMYEQTMKVLAPYQHEKSVYLVEYYFSLPQLFRSQPPLEWRFKFNSLALLLDGIMEKSPETKRVTNDVRADKSELEDWLHRQIADDMAKKNPDVLMISWQYNNEFPKDPQFNLKQWMEKDAGIRTLMEAYEQVGEGDFFEGVYSTERNPYVLYIRKTEKATP